MHTCFAHAINGKVRGQCNAAFLECFAENGLHTLIVCRKNFIAFGNDLKGRASVCVCIVKKFVDGELCRQGQFDTTRASARINAFCSAISSVLSNRPKVVRDPCQNVKTHPVVRLN